MNEVRTKLEQNLGWIVLALLLGGCLLVMLPFVSALLWGLILSVSSWPLYRRLLSLLRGGLFFKAILHQHLPSHQRFELGIVVINHRMKFLGQLMQACFDPVEPSGAICFSLGCPFFLFCAIHASLVTPMPRSSSLPRATNPANRSPLR